MPEVSMMFPRSNSLVRAGALVGFLVLTVWLYIIVPPALEPSDVVHPGQRRSLDTKGASPTRSNTPLNVSIVTKPKQTHHHSNETLQKLANNNMTLIKANKSALQSIIKTVNESKGGNESKILHPHPFKYIINSEHICHKKNIFLIVYIHTAPKHYKRRMVIRQTWGNPKYYDVPIRVVFVMGKTINTAAAQNALTFESEQYNDIVQEDFQDSYKNLTYKGVAGLKWISNYCKHAKFVLKSDDDIFVNMFTLLRHLKSRERLGTNRGLLMCLVWNRMIVMRKGKWKVDEKDFKDKYYPTYCSGSAFTMSTDVAIGMHRVSYYVPFFWVDDFYITGLLPMKLGVKHTQFMSTYVLDGRKLEDKFTGPQWYTYIFSHVHNLNKIQSVWSRLVDLERGEVLPDIKYALPPAPPKPKVDPKKADVNKIAAKKEAVAVKAVKTPLKGGKADNLKTDNKKKS